MRPQTAATHPTAKANKTKRSLPRRPFRGGAYAAVAKLADAQDLGSCAGRRIGSRPIGGTTSSQSALFGYLPYGKHHVLSACSSFSQKSFSSKNLFGNPENKPNKTRCSIFLGGASISPLPPSLREVAALMADGRSHRVAARRICERLPYSNRCAFYACVSSSQKSFSSKNIFGNPENKPRKIPYFRRLLEG